MKLKVIKVVGDCERWEKELNEFAQNHLSKWTQTHVVYDTRECKTMYIAVIWYEEKS